MRQEQPCLTRHTHEPQQEFRRAGYATVDWIVHYMQWVETLPVLS